MNDVVPLLLLLAFGSSHRQPTAARSSPRWPSAASPPPMPSLPGPSADSGTPLSDLAAAASAPQPSAATAAPPSDKVRMPPPDKLTAAALKRAAKAKAVTTAKRAAAKKGKTIFQRIVKAGPPVPTQQDVSVSNLQSVLVRRGYKSIKKDGLYGPKTELAWKALANGNKLSPMISRVGPKVARVAKDTYTTLSIP